MWQKKALRLSFKIYKNLQKLTAPLSCPLQLIFLTLSINEAFSVLKVKLQSQTPVSAQLPKI